MTDPWFSQRRGYYWGEPLGMSLGDLPGLTGVAASHGHYDHYDIGAFAAYPDKAVPLAVKRGTAEAARVTAAPAKHGVPENTYVFEANGFTVFFGADTLLIPELSEVARRFPKIDLALLPINGLAVRVLLNRQMVMNAREAAELCAILRPRYAVPIHYRFTAGPVRDRLVIKHHGDPEEFAREASGRAPGTRVRILEPGEPLTVSSDRES